MTEMHRWERIGRQLGGGWLAGERYESQRNWQERLEREHMSGTDTSATIIKNAGRKAANIYSMYASSVKAARENKLVPAEGREQLMSEARDKAVSDLRELEQRVEAAVHVEKARLSRRRDEARPKVSEAERARIEGYYTRLADSGVNLERLIELADGDAVALRCLEDLAPVLAMSARPDDPNAADGFTDLVRSHALNAYGEKYREAYGEIEKAERAAYLSNMSVNQAVEAVQGKDDTPVFVDTDGQVISAT